MKKKLMNVLLIIGALGMLQGCASLLNPSASPSGVNLETISLMSSRDLNQNFALTVHLVAVYDKDLFGTLKKMSSDVYFKSSEQLIRDNPELLSVWKWELVPLQILGNYNLVGLREDDAWGVLLFAQYFTGGAHRAVIPNDAESIRVTLGRTGIMNVRQGGDFSDVLKTYQAYPVNSSGPQVTSHEEEEKEEGENGDHDPRQSAQDNQAHSPQGGQTPYHHPMISAPYPGASMAQPPQMHPPAYPPQAMMPMQGASCGPQVAAPPSATCTCA